MVDRPFKFPLVDSSYDNQEILSCISTLLSSQLTMGPRVRMFEELFAKEVGAKYCVMVNSGSSANLLALSASTNPRRKKHLAQGDKVAIPAVCWSTSLWPIIQVGLIPVFVDVETETLNMSMDSLRSALDDTAVKAIMMVHVLGNSTDINELLEIVEDNDLLLVEDTCESLGSTFNKKQLGTLGVFGTYSFYFSHHMTTIEGGMISTDSPEDYDLLKCIRSHGWSRELSNKREIESMHSEIDPRFLFWNIGYNLRPMEIQASFGIEQIRRLGEMNRNRKENVQNIRMAFRRHPKWKNQLLFPEPKSGIDPCWFGFPFLLSDSVVVARHQFCQALMEKGIDTRPIISGNMAIQPATKLFNIDTRLSPYPGAQAIHDRGYFIGCHSRPLKSERIDMLVDSILGGLEENEL